MSMKPKAKRWRALIKLVYSDLIPEKAGQPLAEKGDITELYPEFLKYPDRITLLENLGYIEPVPDSLIIREVSEVKE